MDELPSSLSQHRGSRLKIVWCSGQPARTATAHHMQPGPSSCPSPSSLAPSPSHAHTLEEKWNKLRSAAITHQAPNKPQTKAETTIAITHVHTLGKAEPAQKCSSRPSGLFHAPNQGKDSYCSEAKPSSLRTPAPAPQAPLHLPIGQRLPLSLGEAQAHTWLCL